jgi:cytidylate kinase
MEAYVRTMEAVIRDLAAASDVCILGRAGQVILRDRPDTLHVQIVAPLEKRIETVMKREGLSRAKAMERVLNSDRMRHEYLRRYYEVEWLDPCLYDLVINMGRVSFDTAVDLIVRAVADI